MMLRREVYVKEHVTKSMVRKLVVWQCEDGDYVVHWTDYSSSRGKPLKRDVRLAVCEASAMRIADEMVAKNVRRGWSKL